MHSQLPTATWLGAALALMLAGACGTEVTNIGGGGAAGSNSTTTTTTSSGTGGQGNSSQGGQGGQGAGAQGGSGGGGVVDCNPTSVSCDGPIPFCQPGEVPEVISGCWGECVPIMSCATEANCDNCQTGFCAAYEAWTTEVRCVMPSLQCSALACSCLSPYFCISPFDECLEAPSVLGADVRCACPSC